MNVRRLPGFMYHYKVVTVLLFSTMLLVIYLLLHWGIMCTNFEAWRHVSNVVSPFEHVIPAGETRITVTRRTQRARIARWGKMRKRVERKGQGTQRRHARALIARNQLILSLPQFHVSTYEKPEGNCPRGFSSLSLSVFTILARL